MDRKLLFSLSFIFVVLVGFWLYALFPHVSGNEWELKLAPVDPTDLFAGDYMMLRYDGLSRISPNSPTSQHMMVDDIFHTGDMVYAQLLCDESTRICAAAAFTHTSPNSNTPYLIGTVTGANDETAFVDYGLERYYIPAHSGDRVRVDGNWTARIVLDRYGGARVVGLKKNGQEYVFAP